MREGGRSEGGREGLSNIKERCRFVPQCRTVWESHALGHTALPGGSRETRNEAMQLLEIDIQDERKRQLQQQENNLLEIISELNQVVGRARVGDHQHDLEKTQEVSLNLISSLQRMPWKRPTQRMPWKRPTYLWSPELDVVLPDVQSKEVLANLCRG